ncbi:MAG: class I SAM-dependent methyltransferase [Candidatus Binatia bacterium]
MSDERRRHWDQRHGGTGEIGTPSAFVVRALDTLAGFGGPTAGSLRALDVACGRGRHALLLAERGYAVEAVDFSLPALVNLKHAASARDHAVACLAADVTTWPMPTQRYALVVVVSFLERGLFGALRNAVMPGGALLYETYTGDESGMPPALRPEFVLEPGELDRLCDGWRILLRQTDVAMHGTRRTARAGILAQRPPSSSPSTRAH